MMMIAEDDIVEIAPRKLYRKTRLTGLAGSANIDDRFVYLFR